MVNSTYYLCSRFQFLYKSSFILWCPWFTCQHRINNRLFLVGKRTSNCTVCTHTKRSWIWYSGARTRGRLVCHGYRWLVYNSSTGCYNYGHRPAMGRFKWELELKCLGSCWSFPEFRANVELGAHCPLVYNNNKKMEPWNRYFCSVYDLRASIIRLD